MLGHGKNIKYKPFNTSNLKTKMILIHSNATITQLLKTVSLSDVFLPAMSALNHMYLMHNTLCAFFAFVNSANEKRPTPGIATPRTGSTAALF
jgi:hypothetical protein